MRQLLAFSLLLAAPPALGDTLTVRITGIQAATGNVRIALCSTAFDASGCSLGKTTPAVMPGLEIQFPGIEPGTYAIAVFHDQNGDGEQNRNMLGLPTEPYGFSNDVGRFAPPSFDAARFQVRGDTAVEIRVKPLLSGQAGN